MIETYNLYFKSCMNPSAKTWINPRKEICRADDRNLQPMFQVLHGKDCST